MGERTESFLQKRRLHILLIILLGLLAYSNTFTVPFYFDDTNIIENVRIRDVTDVPSMFIDISGLLASRPLMNATFAVNYWLGGFNTSGYHIVNLALHLLNGVLLYLLVAMTGKHLGHEEKTTISVALLSSMLFVLHPVQTEAVTYIVSRSMLLATAFYLSGLMLFFKAVTSENRRVLYMAGLLVVSLLGMASREDFVTFPLMLLLYDLFFISGFNVKDVSRHFRFYLPAFLSLGYLAFLVLSHDYPASAGFDIKKATPLEYLMTQFNVIFTYLRLLIFPFNQNLDYHYRMAKTLLELPTLFSFFGYLGLWAIGILGARKWPIAGFAMLWFLITLLPSSSIMPLDDLIFEHRLYLPAAGILVLAAFSLLSLAKSKRVILAGVPIIVLALGATTYTRNAVWSDGISLWSDVVKKSPGKARGYGNLALTFRNAGDLDGAIAIYEVATTINPNFADAHNNLGTIYIEKGLTDWAIEHFEIALRLEPENATAHYNLATLYFNQLPEKAKEHFKKALKIQPALYQAHYNLGLLYLKEGLVDEAIEHLKKVTRLRPDYVKGYFNLGRAYSDKGLHERALEYFLIALRYRPDDPYLHRILADTYRAAGDVSKAQEFLTKAEALERASGAKTDR